MKSKFVYPYSIAPLVTQLVLWIFCAYTTFYLIQAGFSKVSSVEPYGVFPAWLMVIVGIIQIVGPLVMFYPRFSFYGAFPVGVVMAVAFQQAALSDGFELGDLNHIALRISLLAFITAWILRPRFLRPTPKITKIKV